MCMQETQGLRGGTHMCDCFVAFNERAGYFVFEERYNFVFYERLDLGWQLLYVRDGEIKIQSCREVETKDINVDLM